MSAVLEFVKATSRLASPFFVVTLFGVGIALLYGRRTAAWGRRWVTAVLLVYWLLSLPFGAWLITLPATRHYRPLASRDQAAGAQAVVMLGGGILTYLVGDLALDDVNPSALRLLETVRVYRLLGDPLVIVSGGNTVGFQPPRPEAHAYREAIASLGIPRTRVLVEDQSLTTRQEVLILKPMLEAHAIHKFVLVTTPTHMGRSLAAFRAVGLDPIPSSAPLKSDASTPLFWTIIPDRQSLSISDVAVYDYAAWAYYWARGWQR